MCIINSVQIFLAYIRGLGKANKLMLTSQVSPFNLLESVQANLGVNWASQDIAGACRSLRSQHYANGQCNLQ